MSYRWHSQRQNSFDTIRLTWIAIGKRSQKEEEEHKYKEEHKKCNFRINVVTIKEEKNNLHQSHSQYKIHSHSPMKL